MPRKRESQQVVSLMYLLKRPLAPLLMLLHERRPPVFVAADDPTGSQEGVIDTTLATASRWVCPGGKMQPGDVDEWAALRREMLEETGAHLPERPPGDVLTYARRIEDGDGSLRYWHTMFVIVADNPLAFNTANATSPLTLDVRSFPLNALPASPVMFRRHKWGMAELLDAHFDALCERGLSGRMLEECIHRLRYEEYVSPRPEPVRHVLPRGTEIEPLLGNLFLPPAAPLASSCFI